MVLHVCAPGEDANNETKGVGVSVSRKKRTKQLAEKEGKAGTDQFTVGQESQDGGKIAEKGQGNKSSSLLFK